MLTSLITFWDTSTLLQFLVIIATPATIFTWGVNKISEQPIQAQNTLDIDLN